MKLIREISNGDLSDSTAAESEELVQEIEEIPHLLMVEMQKEAADDVVNGTKDLADHLRPENKHCRSNIQEAASCGAPSVLVLVMRKWHTNEVIQTFGCCCIFYLSSNVASRIAVAKAGGLETIVEAMTAFPTSQGIQFAGCGAIMKALAAVGNKGADSLALRKATRRFVHYLDGVSLMLRAMIQFRRLPGFQAICLEALDNLASEEEFYDVMMKSNVVKAVASALELHGEQDETCHQHATRFMDKAVAV